MKELSLSHFYNKKGLYVNYSSKTEKSFKRYSNDSKIAKIVFYNLKISLYCRIACLFEISGKRQSRNADKGIAAKAMCDRLRVSIIVVTTSQRTSLYMLYPEVRIMMSIKFFGMVKGLSY